MGQQQLLLIILALIVVAIAIVVGLGLFEDEAAASNRQAIIKDLHHLASLARKYYRTPTSVGGGGGTFEGFQMSPGMKQNANAAYDIFKKDHTGTNHMHFQGIGNEKGKDGTNPIRIELKVWLDDYELRPHN